MTWRVEFLNDAVGAELDALPYDMQARFYRIVDLIQSVGAPFVREPHVKSLGHGIFEMRMSGRDGTSRALYLLATGERVVVLLVFIKKTQKTPAEIIKKARERAKEVR